MKISDIITAGVPTFFQLDSTFIGPPTNRDVLSFLEHLMASAETKISRKDAALMIAKHIDNMKIPNSRSLNNLLK